MRSAFIPTELNTTANWLSRVTYSAQNTDFAFRPSWFIAVGGLRCNTCLCSDPQGRSAMGFLGGRKPAWKRTAYCSPDKCMFTRAKWLAGRAIWFNPPFPLLEATLQLLHRVHMANTKHTYLLGCIPYLPDRVWFQNHVGPGKLLQIKNTLIYKAGCQPFIRMSSLRRTPFNNLHHAALHNENNLLASPTGFDLAIIEAQPLPH